MIKKTISKALHFLIIMSAILLLFGCQSHNEIIQHKLESAAASHVSLSCDELLLSKGAPDSIAKLSTGEEVWTYKASKTGEKKGMIVTVGNTKNAHRPLTTWTETINFIVENGIVRGYKVSVD